MRRYEAIAALALAVLLLVAGFAWLFGPLGLIASGAALLSVTLFVLDVEGQRGEALGTAGRRTPVGARR
jgi:predicted PurR-regulated permease PerM